MSTIHPENVTDSHRRVWATEGTIALAAAAPKDKMAKANRLESRDKEKPPLGRKSKETLAENQPNNSVISTEPSYELSDSYCFRDSATSHEKASLVVDRRPMIHDTDVKDEVHMNDPNQKGGTSHQGNPSVSSTVAAGPKRRTKAETSSTKRFKSTDTKATFRKSRSLPKSHSKNYLPKAAMPEAPRSVLHTNCIEEVLDESDDLLRCAYEAQSLGRLSEAQSFLYLAHARLVGLGRLVGCGNVLAEENDGFLKRGDTNQEDHLSCELKSTTHTMSRMHTPHAERLALKPKITPSPCSTNTPAVEEPKTLSGYLAQSAQELLYKRRGIGKRNVARMEQKACHNNGRKAQSKTFDAKLVADNSEKENTGNTKEHEKHLGVSGSVAWNASVMTSNGAELDAKVLMKKGTPSSL